MSSLSNYATGLNLIDTEIAGWLHDDDITIQADPMAMFGHIDDLGELCQAYDEAVEQADTRRQRRRLTNAYAIRAKSLARWGA